MAIPETQLDTWSHQGSVTQSANTYASIKNALMDVRAAYADRSFEVFLQGSYGNDTNIFSESDVDVVIRYDGAFFHDLSRLPEEQKQLFERAFPNGAYLFNTFRDDVKTALELSFGSSVKSGQKAIDVQGNGTRRSADVLAAFEFRRYHKFKGSYDEKFDRGLCFLPTNGGRIENYPKQHSDNCTLKHGSTYNRFKPVVRIFKNIRSKLVDDGILAKGVAPSYFIEGLLYNVPNSIFIGNYPQIVFNTLRWLEQTTDRSRFVCANEQFYLLRNDPVCWSEESCSQFLQATIMLWNNW